MDLGRCLFLLTVMCAFSKCANASSRIGEHSLSKLAMGIGSIETSMSTTIFTR